MPECTEAAARSAHRIGSDLVVRPYEARDNDEALALERHCIQGTSYRMSFRRPVFHRRAEQYPLWRILTARLEGSLIGLVAAAIKPVEVRGEHMSAAFFFDLRVHPAFRGRGVGRRLTTEIRRWTDGRSAMAYTYGLADNRAAGAVVRLGGGVDVGGFRYLVYPVYRTWSQSPEVAAATFAEVHQTMKRVAGPFDLYAHPDPDVAERQGYVASWIVRRGPDVAGCSAWSHGDVLAEVIEAVPPTVELARRLTSLWPLRRARWPHLPGAGECLRSWYLFDWFATDGSLARSLMRHVAAAARARGIDYCYVVHGARDRWVRSLRSDVPSMFAPVLRYRLWADLPARLSGPLDHAYVDVRDL